ncbi:c-type cytochrome [Phenylobacterium sp. 58.2.17]|uniref:c-type cytochrome n=1 Tax=Phenylobacterium sp. 58.2.17 TaxID=2969306 RepID=UPI002264A258|nr:cytochrome c [Phenylobacterium sp. 58.2.17]MCX7587067.1 cytochrome c [Phenylobacterium sp. 58.2.17]
MKTSAVSAFVAALAATSICSAPAEAQPQPQAGTAWRGCCGVTPWPHGGGMMGGGGMMRGGMMGGSSDRHHVAMMGGVPAPYTNLTNPLPQGAATIKHGAAVYAANCTSCHGTTGLGDGEAARALSPRPASLAWLSNMPISRWDAFMYWSVAEGGEQFNSGMPAFKDSLSKDDIWAVIGYIQAHLPAAKASR